MNPATGHDGDTAQAAPWYRHAWPWLLMLPPALAVAGGVTMIWLATHTPAQLVIEDYARIEEITAERFALDASAGNLHIAAAVAFDRSAPDATRVSVRLAGPADGSVPAALRLAFRHVTEARLDREVVAQRSGEEYHALIDLAGGAYFMDIEPPQAHWRLSGRMRATDTAIELRPGAQR